MSERAPQIPCTAMHIRRAGRQISKMYDRYLRPTGIRAAQYAMLRTIAELHQPFISDVGRILSMDQTTVTRNVEKLEKAGLVVASVHPDDPRKKVLELSETARAKMAEALPLWEAAQQRLESRMGQADLGQLILLLQRAAEAAK